MLGRWGVEAEVLAWDFEHVIDLDQHPPFQSFFDSSIDCVCYLAPKVVCTCQCSLYLMFIVATGEEVMNKGVYFHQLSY